MEKAHSKTFTQVSEFLKTDLKKGLSNDEAKNRLSKHGLNVLKEAKPKSPFLIFFSQFTSFLVLILLAASAVSFFLGEEIDALMIMIIVFINAIVGFIQEYRVEKSILALKKLVSSNSDVYRNGQLIQIPSQELVPGDLVVIEEGQKITADIRLTLAINLETVESSLTGESTPIAKNVDPLPENLPIADQKNMLFSGTIVSTGRGMGVVVFTGMNTEIGKIAHLVSTEADQTTPMQKKLDHLGGMIGKIVLGVAVMVGAEEMMFGEQQLIEALISGVALSVAAIPEGLPAVVTISLALGTKRLLKQQALIKNLPASETLGSTDIICTDKTGTLTRGQMSVRKIFLNNTLYELEEEKDNQVLFSKILKFGVLASNARVSGNSENIIGDTTEAALIVAAQQYGIDQNELLEKHSRLDEIPFSSTRKMMTTVSQTQTGQLITSKGALEMILEKCKFIEINEKSEALTEEKKSEILKTAEEMAQGALRVLAFAFKESTKTLSGNELEENLIFLGLVGMMDPPRDGVREIIATCQNEAGIKVIMITGDHQSTANAIASEVGIVGKSLTGEELDKLSDEDFAKVVNEISIYARVNPEHKIRIVKALKVHGHQVAMTGDGVNDAPALKAADIGIAMGITGTDVAKESSDIILLDDNFKTIVAAIKEGRGIYDNIRKFVTYLLSVNAMEVLVIFVAVLAGMPLPLLPIHLLWINLVTDGLPAIALGVDPVRKNIMNSSPDQFKEEIVSRKYLKILGVLAVIISIGVLGIIAYSSNTIIHAQSLAFTAIVLYEMLVIVAIRSQYNLSLLSNKFLTLAIGISIGLQIIILYLPFSIFGTTLQQLFKVQPLSPLDWSILLIVGIILYFVMKLVITKPQTQRTNTTTIVNI